MRITHLPDRHGRLLPEREEPAPEQGVGACGCCGPGCTQLAKEAADAEASAARRSQIRTVDRSERIRTYNFPENRISDHRTGFKSYNLDTVLDGELDAVVQSAVDADEAARMAAVAEGSGVTDLPRDAVPGCGDGAARPGSRASASPEADAVALAAHVLGVVRSRERAQGDGARRAPDARGIRRLVEQRAARVPLQHLTGRAGLPPARAQRRARGVRAPPGDRGRRGPGDRGRRSPLDAEPVVVDLCTGSGAIALAVKDEVPHAQVYAVELGEDAHAWAARNVADTGLEVDLAHGDATHGVPRARRARSTSSCRNPPYIPVGMVPVDPEVRDHDPELALYGGSEDGLASRSPSRLGRRCCCRPGGLLVMEHADSQGALAAGCAAAHAAGGPTCRPARPGRPTPRDGDRPALTRLTRAATTLAAMSPVYDCTTESGRAEGIAGGRRGGP